ncbi:MAG: hypothetical protein FWC73_07665 [Defluviitaleaceae bacterium]|nr:hypothetical protein [Defluviitaleaceae bacterium]
MWRWDQGRLLYFQFDVLKSMAAVLAKFDGVKINDCESLFRSQLMTETGMPFAPDHYTVLRNYKRVFECAFLATVSNKHLIVSDFCRELAKPNGDFANADDFLLSYINRFRFPFPAFDGYDDTQERVYPFCAVIKFLIVLFQGGKEAVISLDEIFNVIIANKCTGFEELPFYNGLHPQNYNPSDTEKRQLREMVIFISQLSVLKVYGGKLWLDISNPTAINELMEKFLTPLGTIPKSDRLDEFAEMTKITGGLVLPTIEVFTSDSLDLEFIEGKRKRVEHFRVERSPLLRKYFREQNKRPICNMCHMDVSEKYPWTEYMLDIHHLLPLSSSVAITTHGTSLNDIVGICPSCHRSVHIYYSKWLKKNGQDDFNSRIEAMEVYLAAVKEVA